MVKNRLMIGDYLPFGQRKMDNYEYGMKIENESQAKSANNRFYQPYAMFDPSGRIPEMIPDDSYRALKIYGSFDEAQRQSKKQQRRRKMG